MTLSVRQLSKGHVVNDVTEWLSSRFERVREAQDRVVLVAWRASKIAGTMSMTQGNCPGILGGSPQHPWFQNCLFPALGKTGELSYYFYVPD